MKKLKLFFACLLMAVLSIGQVWAAVAGSVASSIADGDQVILINKDANKEFTEITGNVGQKADYTTAPAGTCVLTVETGKSGTNTFSFKMSNGSYLAYTSTSTSSNNYLHSVSDISSANAKKQVSWTVTFNENNEATVTNVYNTSRVLKYNSSSPRFCCYTSGQQLVKFFKLSGAAPTLTSITVDGDLENKSYEEGGSINFTGLTATGTYDDESTDDLTDQVEWSFSPALAVGTSSYTVTATLDAISGNKVFNDINVTAHTITPDEYAINLNNTFFGVATGNNGEEQTKTKNDITFVAGCASTAQNKTYYDAAHVRFYADSYLHISVPSGYRITSIVFTAGGTWNGGISANVGSYAADTKTWSGKAQEVDFSFTSQDRIATATVTFEVDAPETACETPTFDPAAGEYEGAQNVTISCATEGATIYYTTDGTDPDNTKSEFDPLHPIVVNTNTTIRAIAIKTGLLNSAIAEAAYTFVAGPEVTLDFTTNDEWEFPTEKTVDAGEYTAGEYTITVAGTTGKGYNFDTDHLFLGQNGAYITLPTFDFPVSKVVCVGVGTGSGSVTFNLFEGNTAVSTAVTSCKVDQTFEIDAEDQASNKTYTIKLTNANNARFAKIKVYRGVEPAVKKPVISGEENFVTSAEVTITCETTGATIYYTTNGDDPKVSGITSPNPFTLTDAATVKAAAKLGDDWSAIAEKTFTKISALTTMEQVQAAMPAEGTEHINIVIEDWIVTANRSGQSQVWIANADNTKGILLYQSGHGFAAGNKLNGVVLNVGITKYNTAPQLMSFTSEDVTVTTASDITPNETTIDAITTAIQGTVIKLKDLTYSSANSNFSDGEHTIAIDTRLYTPALVNDATYDLTGVVMFASGGAVKLIPRSEEDVVKTSADPLPEVNNLAGLKAAEKGSYVVNLVDAVVTLVDGNNAFIEDATAGALIYKSNHGFSAGDKLNGSYEVTTADHYGKFEITAITAQAGATTTPDAEIPVTTLTIAQLSDNDVFAANESRRIKVVGVMVTDAIGNSDRNGEISEGNNTFILYAGKSGVVAELNANIDAIGYPTYYIKDQTNDHQFSVWAQADITVNEKEDAELSWTRESDVITETQVAFWTAPTLNNPHSVTITSYETSNDEVATVSDGVIALEGGLGTAVITAHFEGDQTYEAADAVYTITVNEYIPANTDIITAAKIGVAGTNAYGDWSGKNTFGTISVYAGNSANAASPNTGAIQLRSKNNSGIILTGSNGLMLKGLSISVASGENVLNVYAKSSAYSSTEELYSNDEAICGKLIGTVSAGALILEENVSYDDNYQFIGMRSNNGALYLNNITITWGAATEFETVRSGLEINRYYTVCLPKKVTAIKGASFWTLNNKSQDGATAYLEEETNNLPFAAGKPFIIQATADKLEVVYEGEATETAGVNGAIHGTLTYMDADALAAAGPNVYMLYNNELRPVGENNHLDANRAYVKVDELDPVSSVPQGAPGKRVIAMPMQKDQAQGFENLDASEKPMKVMIDGTLYILRGEKVYDATGRLVK